MASRGVAPAPLAAVDRGGQSADAQRKRIRGEPRVPGRDRRLPAKRGGCRERGGRGVRRPSRSTCATSPTSPTARRKPADYVFFGNGPAVRTSGPALVSAVTISISKRKGTNAIVIADKVLRQGGTRCGVAHSVGHVTSTVTRNYGETAAEKSNELLFHMLIAILSVSMLIGLTLGRRESGVVATAIPVTLALTLAVFYLVRLHAEPGHAVRADLLDRHPGRRRDRRRREHRAPLPHARERGRSAGRGGRRGGGRSGKPDDPRDLRRHRRDPARWRSSAGLMGPYMRPIPVGATAAMLFSLLVAFVVTPWAAVRLLKSEAGRSRPRDGRGARPASTAGDGPAAPQRRSRGTASWLVVVFLLLGVVRRWCTSSSSRSRCFRSTTRASSRSSSTCPTDRRWNRRQRSRARSATRCRSVPEVLNYPGVRRHRLALQLQRTRPPLLPAPRPERRRHPGQPRAKGRAQGAEPRHRQARAAGGAGRGAQIRRARQGGRGAAGSAGAADAGGRGLRPGVRGADRNRPGRSRRSFPRTKGVVDVDWYVEDDQPSVPLRRRRGEGGALTGSPPSRSRRRCELALSGTEAGLLHPQTAKEDVPIVVRLPRARAFADRGSEAASRDRATGQPGAALAR